MKKLKKSLILILYLSLIGAANAEKCPHYPMDGICFGCGEKLYDVELYKPKETDNEYVKQLALEEMMYKAMMWATVADIFGESEETK